MAIVANTAGVIKGKFTIPAGVRAGSKSVSLKGSGGSFGDAVFVGQGTLVSDVLQSTTRVTQSYFDPLAQTFTLTESNQLGGLEVFVTAKGATNITVQIRETQIGFPTQVILAEATKQPSEITTSQWNRFTFAAPVYLLGSVEYAVVVLCNDAIGSIGIAELGKWDSVNMRWVTTQPYQVGTLLSSSNASTWTAHQDKDMAFRLLARRYTGVSKLVDLGPVAVSGATDLVVLSMVDNPATGADSELQLTMPDGTMVSTSDGQNVQFTSPVTGNIGVKALLRSTDKASSALYPGSQIVAGAVTLAADYVSRAMDADAAGSRVRVIFDANLPSGSGVTVFLKGVDAGDAWQAMPQLGVSTAVGDGIYEYQYELKNVQEAKIQVKLHLTGTVAARPFVYRLRASVIASAT
ncbi:hypothetical protein [Pseudomonas sp.]|uniref:hypothetical protein n=1 Tax=Pseudomonas sp. TaxID=306 RepID=UPI003FD7F30B